MWMRDKHFRWEGEFKAGKWHGKRTRYGFGLQPKVENKTYDEHKFVEKQNVWSPDQSENTNAFYKDGKVNNPLTVFSSTM